MRSIDDVARIDRSFVGGAALTGSLAGTVLLLLYTVIAPTGDLRARIPFLIWGAVPPLVIIGTFATMGNLVLVIARSWSGPACRGALLGALAVGLTLYSDVLPRVLPEMDTPTDRGIVAMIEIVGGVTASTFILSRLRRTKRSP